MECGRAENRSCGICLRLGEGASCWRHVLRSSEETRGASRLRRRISWTASFLVMLIGSFSRRHEKVISIIQSIDELVGADIIIKIIVFLLCADGIMWRRHDD